VALRGLAKQSIFEVNHSGMELKFITDEKGRQIEVIVPIAEWKKIKKRQPPKKTASRKSSAKKFKRELKKTLEEGFKQIKLHQAGKIKLKTLDELISEL